MTTARVIAVFADGSTWDVSTMTARQWRLVPARRAQHGKKEANVCWLGEHAVSHHNLAVQFRRQSGRADIVAAPNSYFKSLGAAVSSRHRDAQ